MKVFVIGSFRKTREDDGKKTYEKFEPEATPDDLRAACNELGRQLALKKHELIVGSDKSHVVDLPTVEGYMAGESPKRIWVFRPTRRGDGDPAYSDLDCEFMTAKTVTGPYAASHAASVKHADVVIALGGSERGTLPVIYVALALGVPVAVPKAFEGAAIDAWRDLEHRYDSEDMNAFGITATGQDWAEKVVEQTERLAKRNPWAQTSKLQTGLQWVALALLVGVWIASAIKFHSLVESWHPVVMLFGGSLAGCLTGLILRNVAAEAFNNTWRNSSFSARFGTALLGILIFICLSYFSSTLLFRTAEKVYLWDQQSFFVFSFLGLAFGLFATEAVKRLLPRVLGFFGV